MGRTGHQRAVSLASPARRRRSPASQRRITGSQNSPIAAWISTASTIRTPGTVRTSAGTAHSNPPNDEAPASRARSGALASAAGTTNVSIGRDATGRLDAGGPLTPEPGDATGPPGAPPVPPCPGGPTTGVGVGVPPVPSVGVGRALGVGV